jgi:hypothetical protein
MGSATVVVGRYLISITDRSFYGIHPTHSKATTTNWVRYRDWQNTKANEPHPYSEQRAMYPPPSPPIVGGITPSNTSFTEEITRCNSGNWHQRRSFQFVVFVDGNMRRRSRLKDIRRSRRRQQRRCGAMSSLVPS